MNEKDVKRVKNLYRKYALEDVKAKLGIEKRDDYEKGLLCGCKIAYEMSLRMILSYEDYKAFQFNTIKSFSNELNVTYKTIEEVI